MSWLEAAVSFATMRPTAQLDGSSCTRRHASGCERCAAMCPKDAIALERWGAVVDADSCVGCGLCVTACPVGAIDGVGQVPSAVAVSVSAGASLRCDVARLLAPEMEGSFVDVPCVGAVHPESLAAGALRAGGATVVPGPCEACPVGSAAGVREVLDVARQVLVASGSGADIVEAPATAQEAPRRRWGRRQRVDRARASVSRRALFGLQAPEPEAPPAGLEELPATASPRDVLLVAEPDAALPALTADDRCTACGGCVRTCPTDALVLREGALAFSPVDCVACGECVRVCPEDALAFVGRAPGRSAMVLVVVEQSHCDRCARPLGPGESGICHNCLVRGSLASGIV